ncbi:MAG TPA: PQQ-dependent sugar dehydrogenase [Candidatus Polarisedimenticolia bacterium]|nr:PQQ-dependent sugar dehydrogenase [Candidatus Polarisedimenticolia bacterium]
MRHLRRRVAAALLACAAGWGAASHCLALGDCAGIAPVGSTQLRAVPVATGLAGRPLFVASPPGDRDRLFIVMQSGTIRIKHRGDPASATTLFLDITSKVQASTTLNEMGLLGLAFDPQFAANGRFYVNYTEGLLGGPWFTVVARYTVSAGDPDVADPGSEVRLLRFSQPQSNHNGGQLQFGLDGYLYISTGDGGGSGDQHGTCGNGQSLSTLHGKLLRVDVRDASPGGLPDCGGASAIYRVPSDNPFGDGVGGSACDEIWDYGLRNPWRSSFDPLTGDLYLGDVGQNCWEEVNHVPGPGGGRNYGWRQMEGRHCFNPAAQSNCDPAAVACGSSPPCGDPSLTLPIVEYSSVGACSVTGGYVYRGCQMPLLDGRYLYGDFCGGWVKSFVESGGLETDPVDHTPQLGIGSALAFGLTSFGVDDDGEIYVVDRDGVVYRLTPPFTDLEVSAAEAATPFAMGPPGWSWEDLHHSMMQPVSSYRVHRGQPGGSFQCVFSSASPSWPGGDPAVPAAGAMHAYVVTAVNAAGQSTVSGAPPHTILPDPCP